MSSLSQQLCNFADATKFEDLPQDVINEAKRLIMDSIASAFAGIGSDKGKFAIELSQKLGSGNESSIIGARGKTSSSSAAFANGELVNAIDIDAFESPHGHFPPFVIPSILALAESKGASGKDLILATALGCEVARRVDSGMTPASAILDPKRGEHSLTLGNSHFIFGGVVGSSKILKQNQEKMINAFGIAGHFCPVPSERKFQETIPIPMTK